MVTCLPYCSLAALASAWGCVLMIYTRCCCSPLHAQAPIPKQYLELRGRPIATYSLRTFASMPEVGEIVVVCELEYDEVFASAHASLNGAPPLVFARPGKERQDSVFNGLQVLHYCGDVLSMCPARASNAGGAPWGVTGGHPRQCSANDGG